MSLLTPAAYLALERQSEMRNAFIAGPMVGVPRSNRRHSLIYEKVTFE